MTTHLDKGICMNHRTKEAITLGETIETLPYLILLSFERFILWILGGDFVGAIVVGIDNFGFGHFEW